MDGNRTSPAPPTDRAPRPNPILSEPATVERCRVDYGTGALDRAALDRAARKAYRG
ncbi:hypothetical protein SCATT_05930 [Streptantibioticus cattleyicolor NRRL 8057 = DSM 46488]|uniref:Uncharacterized protein n=1 Tax=Streptantibioticus cattleyicolor (strain ATCC 35852 / DSM 46488 / JCM 4925 / NBRC 14057 / NRRL 8057) TaxID=1003195 RepID=G8WRE7_STREN|nr:hypothetical protein SCATT_05930 [Streptantibioticus cattleyicolor NRRL 8057 = DSM 46488]